MAVTRTVNMLPAVFQTDTNKKFLNATLDQLTSESQLQRINGYIGRKFAPTYKVNDSYIAETSADRANYQLEPAVVLKNHDSGDVEFHATYAEALQKLNFYGVKSTDQSNLWENEYYSFNPRIDPDKFINFGQYYWLPNGPDSVDVTAGSIALENTFIVSSDYKNNVYNFSETYYVGNPDIVLARGGTYEFIVNQPGHNFWIQTDPGVEGTIISKSNLSARDVLGVSNNGTEQGKIVFAVPQKDAQEFYVSMPKVQDIDIVISDLTYSQIQNTLLSEIVNKYNGLDNQTTGLNGKYIIFGYASPDDFIDDSFWEGSTRYDSVDYDKGLYAEATLVDEAQRLGIWQIVTTPTEANDDFVVTLNYIQPIPTNQKVSVKSGELNGGTEWYMNVLGHLTRAPLITAPSDILYYQDSANPDMVGIIRLVETDANTIDIEKDILAKSNYISPNGVVFTNGLKVKFDSTVIPATYADTEYYVEGVGTRIRLIPVADLTVSVNDLAIADPDYHVINRASTDNNPWSRSNRWFHKDIVTLTARYNQAVPVFDQNNLAKRPIIEFEPDMKLYNFGYNKKTPVDVYDTTIEQPFITIEGVTSAYVDGTLLTAGMRIIFANDSDPRTRNKIWVVNFANQNTDVALELFLTLADDGDIVEGDSVTVRSGITNKGKTFWYNGTEWAQGQDKTELNQPPLFDVFDADGYSFSNQSKYPTVGTTGFLGNKIFSYGVGAGTVDTVLGFPLSYKNFNQIGDIEFVNNFDSETFNYIVDTVAYNAKINTGLLKKHNPDGTVSYVNTWETISRPTTQYQNISYIYDGFTNSFYSDVLPKEETNIPNLIVYANSKKLNSRQWRKIDLPTGGFRVYVATNFISAGDKIDIFVNSDTTSTLGFYQVPPNLDLNAQNQNFSSLTLGQMRNHIVALSQNSLASTGKNPGVSNLRDISVKQSIGTIFQHSGPATYATLFLANDQVNMIDSVNYASQEYTRFKNKFLEIAGNDPTHNFTDIPGTVDNILKKINAVKNKSFPWYYSDMVPYNDQRNIITYNVFNPSTTRYELSRIFDDRVLSNLAILVYLNGTQLVKGRDYSFSYTSPAVEISAALSLNDTISIIEFANTDGCWIPETPTKLGLYPKFTPEIFTDSSYTTPVNMIRGHDGSLTVAFNDVRDDLLLELETRIYNNLKLEYSLSDFNLYDVLPGKFRSTTNISDFNSLLAPTFMRWVGSNRLDYSTNNVSDTNNDLTWNYRAAPDVIDGELLPGTWRACYQYFFDTQYPDLRPWEMLGFSEEPDWWQSFYGPAPYTKGNEILWNDLAAGYVAAGPRKGYDAKFVRPNLLNLIPVSESGALIPPYGLLSQAANPSKSQLSFVFGNIGPVENAWRNSSEYPYAIQIACALAKPGKYFGLNINKQKYGYNTTIGQYVVGGTMQRITPADVVVHGSVDASNNVNRSAGYLNWIGDYLRGIGIDPSITLEHYVKDHTVQLSYRMAGFSDKKYLKVYAEQHSPNSVNDSIIIPDSDYDLVINKSTPLQKIVYSAVIVERSPNGYRVSGYDLTRPYFTVIPPETTSKSHDLTILDQTVQVYSGFKKFKVSVPYGYEFATLQQVTNFLIGYGLALTAAGFKFDTFDSDLAEVRNWALSVKEFLFWAKQKWSTGGVIVLSPAGDKVVVNPMRSVVDKIDNSFFGSKVVNQNFETLTTESYTINRTGNAFSVKADNGQTICLADLNLVQYEHALIFNNTTMFNDTIYQPEIGSRQYRLKLAGFRTGQWTGNLDPQGFIYNSTTVAQWQPNKDYLKGDLLQYKGLYYSAIKNLPGVSEFDFNQWKQVDKNSIKTGLLANFATNSKISQQFYDVDGVNLESQFDLFGKGLIGYRNRDYLNDLDLDDTSQVKFYQGFIKSKGTPHSFDALLGLSNNNIGGDITFSEEWAFRVGEYGALETNQFVEGLLEERTTLTNPFTVKFDTATDPLADMTVVDPYKMSAELYNPTIFLDRQRGNHINDLATAGYVHFDDIDYTIFNLSDYATLNTEVDYIGSGTTIWCANDFDSNWNVYRLSETQIHGISIHTGLDNILIVTTNNPHGLVVDDVVLLKSAAAFTGFYRIVATPSLTKFSIEYTGNLYGFQGLTDLACPILYLHSSKFDYASEIATFVPRDGWRTTETAWVNNDTNGWAVYKKSEPWASTVELTASETVNAGLYGSSVAIGRDNNFAVVGQPGMGDGRLISYVNGFNNQLVEDAVLNSYTDNTSGLGAALGQGTDYTVAGAPNSLSDQGYVYVTKRLPNGNLVTTQILAAPDGTAGDLYGAAVAVSKDDQWAFVGAPNADKVYVYGLQADTVTKLSNIESTGTGTEFTLGFVPDSIDSIVVSDSQKIYVPYVDYTVSGDTITFTTDPAAGSYAIQQVIGYRYIATIEGTAGSNFGYSLATTTDGAQVIVGAPSETIDDLASAGAVYVYDRSIESFIAIGDQTVFFANRYVKTVGQVKVNGTVQGRTNTSSENPTYNLAADTRIVQFIDPVSVGSVVTIETNDFNLLNRHTASTPAANDRFGYSVDICGNNCSVYVGAPYYDNSQYNIGAVYRLVNQGRVYGTITGTVQNPELTSGSSLRINDFEVQFVETTLADAVQAINSANIPGITAINNNGYLTINSDSTISTNKLRILPGTGTAIVDLGLEVFAETQIIANPLPRANETFGQKVRIDETGTVLLVGSITATTYERTTFDDGTTIVDHSIDKFVDPTTNSGAVYVLNYLGDARDSISTPGTFVYNQQLDPQSTLSTAGQFGFDFAIQNNLVLVGAPSDNKLGTGAGRVYSFANKTTLTGWDKVREESAKVDPDSVLKMYLYDKTANIILDTLDYIDPAKGKIIGSAEQEITYKTLFDPAIYTTGADTADTIVNSKSHWTNRQLGQVWWDLSTVKYVEYEQDTIVYKSANWGRMFPGSTINVYEWVESDLPPSKYSGEGSPRYADDSAYVQTQYVDDQTGAVKVKYYFWVKDRTSVEYNKHNRHLPVSLITQLIENPKAQDIKFAAILQNNAVAMYNVDANLKSSNIVLHVDYITQYNDATIHTEWALVGENTTNTDILPNRIYNKIIDSLSGLDSMGNPVPDPALPVQQRYGIDVRPRQSVLIDRFAAAKVLVNYINNLFYTAPMRYSSNLSGLYDQEIPPAEGSGEYDLVVADYETLGYVNILIQPIGYKVLVQTDTNVSGLWTIYTKTANNTWFLTRVQSYNVSEYWSFVDWYANGYDESTVPKYVVAQPADLSALALTAGDIVKIQNDGTGNWKLVQVMPYAVNTIGVQNGTVQLKSSLWDYTNAGWGYDNDTFDSLRSDQNPNIEIRSLIAVIVNTILINEWSQEAVKVIFVVMNYVLSEQKYLDWAFKTSFVSVVHNIRKLTQPAVFIKDNQDYYQQYINEVKPYRTTIREYILDYTGVDNVNGYVTDFDLPGYYDAYFNTYRSPSGEYPQDASALQGAVYKDWANHYMYRVSSIEVTDSGSGYTIPPIVTITGSRTNNNATGRAIVSGGVITQIILDNPGSGYTTTPVVTLAGGNGTGGRAYAHLTNGLVRGIKTTLTFDRLTYSSNISKWAANTAYVTDELVAYNNTVYSVVRDFVSGDTFDGNNLTVIDPADLTTANDRIQGYYVPTPNQPGLDFAQLQSGIDYPGVQILGPLFSYNPAYDSSVFDSTIFDSFEIGPDGTVQISNNILDTIIQSQYTDELLGTRPEDINIDGGAYVDTYSSHAPEELVPGIVFDTLDLQVYQRITPNARNTYHSFDIQFSAFSVGGETEFVYNATHCNNLLFVYSQLSGSLTEGTDFTVNYSTRTITLTATLATEDKLFVYAYNCVGQHKINDVEHVVTDVSAEISCSMPFTLIGTQLVFVNGVKTENFILVDNGASPASVQLLDTLSEGDFVHIVNYDWGTTSDSEVASLYPTFANTEEFTVSNLAPVYPDDYTFGLSRSIFSDVPLDLQVVVELNNSRLRPTTVVYYTGNGNQTIYAGPDSAADINSATVLDTDYIVYVDGVLQTLTTDYTMPYPSATGSQSITFTTAPANGSKITIGINKFNQYSLTSDNVLVIDNSIILSEHDVIKVTTFSNTNELGLKTNTYVGNQTSTATVITGLDTVGFDSIEFDSNVSVTLIRPEFVLAATVKDLAYSWVTLNGARLIPNFDFAIQGNTLFLASDYPLSDSDVLVVTTFSEQKLSNPLGYRIFKDMVGNVSYMRISKDHTTELAEDLSLTDSEVVVTDSTNLPEPNIEQAIPGVVMINGERITYYQIDRVTNTLSQIRRGTAGTGANAHSAGTRVVDASVVQHVPLSDNYSFTPNANVTVTTTDAVGNISAQTYTLQADIEYTRANIWYTHGANTATNGQSLASASTTQASFLRDSESFLP